MEKKEILLTGGTGYIGSHTAVALIEAGFSPVIIDNLSNSSRDVLDGIERTTGVKPVFYEADLRDKDALDAIFRRHDIRGIIHFAASKYVNESVNEPLMYYENNLCSLINLVKKSLDYKVYPFIFSSSCTVYGEPEEVPVTEESPVLPAQSPYGNTKQIGEEILTDTARVTPLQVILLRYFNPVGAHPKAEIGELPTGVPQNLVPYLTQTVAGIRKELSVFGNDYPTPDGTPVRDYIHVMDLAEAHVTALKRLLSGENEEAVEIFNIGTGKGNSVMEVIDTFREATGLEVPYRIAGRREGDVTAIWADTTKAEKVLKWKAKRTLKDALADAWRWEKKIRNID